VPDNSIANSSWQLTGESMPIPIPQYVSRPCPVCGTIFTFSYWPTSRPTESIIYVDNLRCPRCDSIAEDYELEGEIKLKRTSDSNHLDPTIKCPNCNTCEGWRTPNNSLAKINGAIRVANNLYECTKCHTQMTVK